MQGQNERHFGKQLYLNSAFVACWKALAFLSSCINSIFIRPYIRSESTTCFSESASNGSLAKLVTGVDFGSERGAFSFAILAFGGAILLGPCVESDD